MGKDLLYQLLGTDFRGQNTILTEILITWAWCICPARMYCWLYAMTTSSEREVGNEKPCSELRPECEHPDRRNGVPATK